MACMCCIFRVYQAASIPVQNKVKPTIWTGKCFHFQSEYWIMTLETCYTQAFECRLQPGSENNLNRPGSSLPRAVLHGVVVVGERVDGSGKSTHPLLKRSYPYIPPRGVPHLHFRFSRTHRSYGDC